MDVLSRVGLRALPTDPHLTTSTTRLIESFYVPALTVSTRYDRGVGYFSSAWLRLAAAGLAALASNGGHARIIASPILAPADWEALCQGADASANPQLRAALHRTIDELEHDLRFDTLGALAWMIADGLLEFRIAVPAGDLDGDFHDKFGIFHDAEGNLVAFHGSPNDSRKAFHNYESITVEYSWVNDREEMRANAQQRRFEFLWNNGDANLRVYELPDAVKRRIVEFTSRTDRPYRADRIVPAPDRWRHQRAALSAFLAAKHGILEMATGTGKTRTAIMIISELRERGLISSVAVIASGTDLLDQWYLNLVALGLPIYRVYGEHHEALGFINDPVDGILLISRDAAKGVVPRLPVEIVAQSLLVCDEVHGMGGPSLVERLAGRLAPFKYRLGLSATPEREYDEVGNRFVESEIGPVIFEFGLREAIQRGILCEFDYVPLEYQFSSEDRRAVQRAHAAYHARTRAGEALPIEWLYQEIARVGKLSNSKLPPFVEYIRANPKTLHRCIIFVETGEYGLLVQDIIVQLTGSFHTYYADDDRENLAKFSRGEVDTLITCHRISEGIDVRSVRAVILFASARARLETVQRLGRCLRIDPNDPQKRATVVDFVRTDHDEAPDAGDPTADDERCAWLSELAATRCSME